MPNEQTYRIPTVVKHDDFLAAVKPLLDLIGVASPDEVYTDIHITGTGRGAHALSRISCAVAARREGDAGDRPKGVVLAERPQEYAELAYCVVVEVV